MKTLITAIEVLVIIFLIYQFRVYGLLIACLLYALITLYFLFSTKERRWKYWLMVDGVAMRIFGKPLKKEYWKKGEWENLKIKWVWFKSKKVKE